MLEDTGEQSAEEIVRTQKKARHRRSMDLEYSARKLVGCVDFDNSGLMGRGGNGGLLSQESIRACDELRLLLARSGSL